MVEPFLSTTFFQIAFLKKQSLTLEPLILSGFNVAAFFDTRRDPFESDIETKANYPLEHKLEIN